MCRWVVSVVAALRCCSSAASAWIRAGLYRGCVPMACNGRMDLRWFHSVGSGSRCSTECLGARSVTCGRVAPSNERKVQSRAVTVPTLRQRSHSSHRSLANPSHDSSNWPVNRASRSVFDLHHRACLDHPVTAQQAQTRRGCSTLKRAPLRQHQQHHHAPSPHHRDAFTFSSPASTRHPQALWCYQASRSPRRGALCCIFPPVQQHPSQRASTC